MVDPYLQSLTERPLNDPKRINKTWLPEGRIPPKRADDAELLNRQANNSARRVRESRESGKKLNALLDYYASTTVPFDRIAGHIGKDTAFVANEMRQRGRTE